MDTRNIIVILIFAVLLIMVGTFSYALILKTNNQNMGTIQITHPSNNNTSVTTDNTNTQNNNNQNNNPQQKNKNNPQSNNNNGQQSNNNNNPQTTAKQSSSNNDPNAGYYFFKDGEYIGYFSEADAPANDAGLPFEYDYAVHV